MCWYGRDCDDDKDEDDEEIEMRRMMVMGVISD
jgi:hypothetical protein